MRRFLLDQWEKLWANFLARCSLIAVTVIVLFVIIYFGELPEFLYTIPIVLLSIVGYSIIEAQEFQKLLQRTMLGIIQQTDYLAGLNRRRLDDMLDRLHQVYYELPEKMPPNNLYQFVKDNILNKYIGKAFIERSQFTWEFQNMAGEDCYEVTYTSNFEIRTLSDKPIEDTVKVSLAVSQIPGKRIEEHFLLDRWYIRTVKIEDESEVKEEIDPSNFVIEGKECLCKVPYKVTKNNPMRIESRRVGYEEAKDRTAHLIFSLPTHGFDFQIIVQGFSDVTFHPKFAGISPPEPKYDQTSGTRFVVKYDGWMIPGNAVTVTF